MDAELLRSRDEDEVIPMVTINKRTIRNIDKLLTSLTTVLSGVAVLKGAAIR